MILARNSEYVWASSCQQVASVFQPVIRRVEVITLSIPVKGRPQVQEAVETEKHKEMIRFFHFISFDLVN